MLAPCDYAGRSFIEKAEGGSGVEWGGATCWGILSSKFGGIEDVCFAGSTQKEILICNWGVDWIS